MPHIEQTIEINAPRQVVTEIARDFERYPEYMEDVKSITVVEADEDRHRIVTEWVGLVRQFKLTVRWTQEDAWDEAEQIDRFRMLAGDYDSMSGEWRFVETSSGCRVEASMDYVYNVPLLGPLVQKVIFNLVKANVERSLEAIKQRAESVAAG